MAVAGTLAGLAACSPPPEAPGEQRAPILGGDETSWAQAGTLYIESEVGKFSGTPLIKAGSGALVAPNVVVTALHVVSRNPSNQPFACDANGNEISGGAADLGPTAPPNKVSVYAGPVPGTQPLAHASRIFSSGSTSLCHDDIAFVVLDTALDLPAYPIHHGAPAQLGATLTVVGYGMPPGTDPGTAVRSQRDVTVRAVGQWIRTFTVSEGPCEGDSGGPALSTSGDELMGVFSSVSSDCTSPSAAPKYTDISYFDSLVAQAFDAAGALPASGGGGGAAPIDTSAAGAGSGTDSSNTGAAPPAVEDDSGCSLGAAAPSGSPLGPLGLLIGLVCHRVRRSRRVCALR